jgi:hypothetical protein
MDFLAEVNHDNAYVHLVRPWTLQHTTSHTSHHASPRLAWQQQWVQGALGPHGMGTGDLAAQGWFDHR